MSSVTDAGFECDDLATIYAALVADMQAIFGTDIDLDPDTLDGQTLGIYAESKADSDQLAQDVYNSWSPSTASGVALSRIVQYNGIVRIPGSSSEVDLVCTGIMGTLIPLNSIVQSTSTGAQFYTVTQGVIDATGTITVHALAQTIGAIAAPAGTVTQIVTPVYGWQSVTNPADAVVGRDEESDEELRIRRAASTETPSQALPESLYGALANLPQVRQVRVYENYESTTDPATGLPPHSFSAVVDGGLDQDIAQIIWIRASIGATQVGNVTVQITDIQGLPHNIKFQRPTDLRVYVTVRLHPLAGWDDNIIPAMQQNIADWAAANWGIGDNVVQSQLYIPINQSPQVFSVQSVYIGTAANPTSSADIVVPFANIARLNIADVQVLKV